MSLTVHSPPEPLLRPPFGSPEMHGYLTYLCVQYHLLAKYPQRHANSKELRRWKLDFKDHEERARLLSIQTKREQWKVASARYYGKHPEVKERKRVIMAEKRAAKKLARHRYDPPKRAKPTPDVGLSAASAALASALSSEKEEDDAGAFSEKEGKSDGSEVFAIMIKQCSYIHYLLSMFYVLPIRLCYPFYCDL
ncbi:hypothetical protein B0H13DRAFT_1898207 [Mycena leptocephala]|nr:hypothetical protein B0H13DRAFT_1898207 [Mycena leptocephala]